MKKKTRSLQRDNLFLDGTKPDFFWKNGGASLSANIKNKIKLNNQLCFWMGSGCSGLIKKTQKLMEKRATQNEWFFHPFCDVY